MRVVLRIGGSVVASPIDSKLIGEYADLLKRLREQGYEMAVVIGGGAFARELIKTAKDLGLNEKDQDEIAISASRILALLFSKKLEKTGCGLVPVTIEDAAECLGKGRIPVMGGLRPGMTTDTVAALVAESVKANLLVKATDQEGVYNKDPRKHPDAVKLDHLSIADLPRIFTEDKHKAGIHQIIDPEAVKVLERSKTRVAVVNGHTPQNLLAAIKGEKIGTLID